MTGWLSLRINESGVTMASFGIRFDFHKSFRPTAPGCLIHQSRESRSILDKLRVLIIIGEIVVIKVFRNFPPGEWDTQTIKLEPNIT
jgi:hypothetical protein